jgi:cytochrome c biogenesis protein CcdA
MSNDLFLILSSLCLPLLLFIFIVIGERFPDFAESVAAVLVWVLNASMTVMGFLTVLSCIAIPIIFILTLTGNWPPR